MKVYLVMEKATGLYLRGKGWLHRFDTKDKARVFKTKGAALISIGKRVKVMSPKGKYGVYYYDLVQKMYVRSKPEERFDWKYILDEDKYELVEVTI